MCSNWWLSTKSAWTLRRTSSLNCTTSNRICCFSSTMLYGLFCKLYFLIFPIERNHVEWYLAPWVVTGLIFFVQSNYLDKIYPYKLGTNFLVTATKHFYLGNSVLLSFYYVLLQGIEHTCIPGGFSEKRTFLRNNRFLIFFSIILSQNCMCLSNHVSEVPGLKQLDCKECWKTLVFYCNLGVLLYGPFLVGIIIVLKDKSQFTAFLYFNNQSIIRI